MWMLPLYLHVNQKSDYDVMMMMRSGLELLMGKFRQIFTQLSARDTSIFSFLDDNLNK